MLVQDRRAHLSATISNNVSTSSGDTTCDQEASCLYALITSRRSVSRRNRASWYLRQLNKLVKCDPLELIEQDGSTVGKQQDDTRINSPPPATPPPSSATNEPRGESANEPPQQVASDTEKDIFLATMTASPSSAGINDISSATMTGFIGHSDSPSATTATISSSPNKQRNRFAPDKQTRLLVTPNTRVLYLSKSIATSVILDLSPSIVSVSPQNDCVFLDSMFDALKRVLHLLVKEHEFPSSQANRQFTFGPKVYVSVIAYTPFVVAKNNQVLIQNRRISSINIDQVLVELWICLNRLIQELHELVMNTCGINFEYETTKAHGSAGANNAFVFAPPVSSGIIRHPGYVLDDIYDLGLFSASLMPRLSRLSVLIITDGLFASANNLNTFRLRSIAVSFVSLATESVFPDGCFGYTTYTDLMKFIAKSTQGVYISHRDLVESTCSLSRTNKIPLMNNPLFKLFSWTLHTSDSPGGLEPLDCSLSNDQYFCSTPRAGQNFNKINQQQQHQQQEMVEMKPENIARLFCIDQPPEMFHQSSLLSTSTMTTTATAMSPSVDTIQANNGQDFDLMASQNYHDWRSFKKLGKNLDADFEQVLSALLREGYLIKSLQVKHRETSTIVARLVLYWMHNLNLEQELQAPYWNSADPFDMGGGVVDASGHPTTHSSNLILKPFLAPSYGDTHCEVIIHGSYNFLHDFYCDTKKNKRRSDYRTQTYQQFEQLILGVKQTYDKLQYLSRFYRDPNLSKVPSFLLHGNSLLFEQPHTHNLTSTIDNVVDKAHQPREFSEYWQEISQLELRNWKNLMHIHTLRLILSHDSTKHKSINCPNANGRYAHIQCRRAMSAISNFIKSYASFALLEDSLYIKFILNKEDDLREIETSATKGFIVIKIKKILPIVVIYLMFTSGIQDAHRVQIVAYIEEQLISCRLRTNTTTNARVSTVSIGAGLSVPPSPSPLTQSMAENILKSKTIYSPNDSCCALMRSPLEQMLRVYSRNMLNEFLAQNLTHGLPGSCPYSAQQRNNTSSLSFRSKSHQRHEGQKMSRSAAAAAAATAKENQNLHSIVDGGGNLANIRYNPVFGKYLYGIRTVHTLNNLPQELVQPIVMNVLAKISAILVNVRIKQGFHIAFNNSGLLTLVAELAMKDYSHEYHSSNCLCQYLVFPAIVINCSGPTSSSVSASVLQNISSSSSSAQQQQQQQQQQASNISATAPATAATGATTGMLASSAGANASSGNNAMGGGLGSKPGSLAGSLANSDHSFMRTMQGGGGDSAGGLGPTSSSPNIQNGSGAPSTGSQLLESIGHNNQGEVKVIREYWIEQQYGISCASRAYHRSLENMRYSEIVDHLYTTDTIIFDCLVTYDLLQLLCDKMSPFYELDLAMALAESRNTSNTLPSVLSPTLSTRSTNSTTTATNLRHTQLDNGNSSAQMSPTLPTLPSNLIEGTTMNAHNQKDGQSRIPLIELEYRFSLVKFLDYCQFASLDTLLFRDRSEYFEPLMTSAACEHDNNTCKLIESMNNNENQKPQSRRKMSVDVGSGGGGGASATATDSSHDYVTSRREHRSSYDSMNHANSMAAYLAAGNTIFAPSLNHLFLETLHKRLKQMHDKELRLSELDRRQLAVYLRKRKLALELGDDATRDLLDDDDDYVSSSELADSPKSQKSDGRGQIQTGSANNSHEQQRCQSEAVEMAASSIQWRCFMRKGNQENLMIVLIPASLSDVIKWTNFIHQSYASSMTINEQQQQQQPLDMCPILVFRCSSTMINDQVLSFLTDNDHSRATPIPQRRQSDATSDHQLIESDLVLHFGRPCKFWGKMRTSNDELDNEILPLNKFSELVVAAASQTSNSGGGGSGGDEKTLELVHFRAFLRKIKNTVLKSRFSSLNDAYLSELFVHKDDILYYINNVDSDTQKKYHVSSHLRGLADFIRSYEDYHESLPKRLAKPCNDLLNSILLQKCGLFINQPMARFNEANPLMKQLHDRKLLYLMRCNYKIELPMLEENLSNSTYLKKYIRWSPSQLVTNHHHQLRHHHAHHHHHHQHHHQYQSSTATSLLTTATPPPPPPPTGNSHHDSSSITSGVGGMTGSGSLFASSLGRTSGARYMDIKCGGTAMAGSMSSSPVGTSDTHFIADNKGQPQQQQTTSKLVQQQQQQLHMGVSIFSPTNESFFLEAFRNSTCSLDELDLSLDGSGEDISLRHEAHMAEVLKRKGERKESHHYRRVLKSKANYNQSHSAIDQALKRVDSLGRLEHFCLTPLLFSPSWRSKLAPVRDHTIDQSPSTYHRHRQRRRWHAKRLSDEVKLQQEETELDGSNLKSSNYYNNHVCSDDHHTPSGFQLADEAADQVTRDLEEEEQQQREEQENERWHQMICYNYIKEYEQYIQTLGFNSVLIRHPSGNAGGTGTRLQTSMSTSQFGHHSSASSSAASANRQTISRKTSLQVNPSSHKRHSTNLNSGVHHHHHNHHHNHRRESLISPSNMSSSSITSSGFIPINSSSHSPAPNHMTTSTSNSSTYNTGYLIKFLNSGCLVFKVGFCKPYVYSILYSIEGERFNNSNVKMNMSAFLDELNNIKVTLHLHSFTYDYHLRSMYSYIARRQMNFSLGYHLISFVDDFRKYYQKAPNYARNHILSGEVAVGQLAVDGQQLYNYMVTHNSVYNLDVLEMTNATRENLLSTFLNGQQQQQQAQHHTQPFGAFMSAASAAEKNLNDDNDDSAGGSGRNHANDYVLIELRREKVRYKDTTKEPDIFECGLLITHDFQESSKQNCLVLKYFLLLTNQRDLYPKLVHADDNIISLGCHRPIRLGLMNQQHQQQQQQQQSGSRTRRTTTSTSPPRVDVAKSTTEVVVSQPIEPLDSMLQLPQIAQPTGSTTTTTTNPTDLDDMLHSSEFLSSGEMSGPQSIISTASSINGITAPPTHQAMLDGASLLLPSSSQLQATTSSTGASITGTSSLSGSSSVRITQSGVDCSNATTEQAADALEAEELAQEQTIRASVSHEQQSSKSDRTRTGSSSSRSVGGDNVDGQMISTSSNRQLKLGGDCEDGVQVQADKSAGATEAEVGGVSSQGATTTTTAATSRRRERTICDEEITYLGYFSSDEMDMLKFLQEKTINLRQHLERIVRAAEIHYRRDYLWHKLMQRQTSGASTLSGSQALDGQQQQQLSSMSVAKSLTSSLTSASGGAGGGVGSSLGTGGGGDQLPLSVDELGQLLQIVEAIDLASLDPNLANFTTMHINWYLKLLKAFNELRQSGSGSQQQQQHRIYTVKASKILLLYLDPKCTTAFILLSINSERGSVELSMLFKDKQELTSSNNKSDTQQQRSSLARRTSSSAKLANQIDNVEQQQQDDGCAWRPAIELEPECQQLISDFVNFCATFMWSTLLT